MSGFSTPRAIKLKVTESMKIQHGTWQQKIFWMCWNTNHYGSLVATQKILSMVPVTKSMMSKQSPQRKKLSYQLMSGKTCKSQLHPKDTRVTMTQLRKLVSTQMDIQSRVCKIASEWLQYQKKKFLLNSNQMHCTVRSDVLLMYYYRMYYNKDMNVFSL